MQKLVSTTSVPGKPVITLSVKVNDMAKKKRLLCVVNKPQRENPVFDHLEAHLASEFEGWEILVLWLHGEPRFLVKALTFFPTVVITFPLTGRGLSLSSYIIKYLTKSALLCYRTEQNIDFRSRQQVKWLVGMDKYGDTLVDYEVFWGISAAEIIGPELLKQNKLSSLDKVRVVGYPPYESYFSGTSHSINHQELPNSMANLISGYKKDNSFLFITGFHLADYSMEDFINAGDCFDPDSKTLHDDKAEAVLGTKKSKKFRELWINNILVAAKRFSDHLFIVKIHPIEEEIFKTWREPSPYNRLANSKNIIVIGTELSIGNLLPHVSRFFHYGSTAISEAYLKKIPSIFVTSQELYSGGKDSTSNWFYSDNGSPNDDDIDIINLCDFIERRIEPKTQPDHSDQVKNLLFGLFNITEANLLGTKPYEPSKEIAKLLENIVNEPSRQISSKDKFLHSALVKAHVMEDELYSELEKAVSGKNNDHVYLLSQILVRCGLICEQRLKADIIIKAISFLIESRANFQADHIMMQLLMIPNMKATFFTRWKRIQPLLTRNLFLGLGKRLQRLSDIQFDPMFTENSETEWMQIINLEAVKINTLSGESDLILRILKFMSPLLNDSNFMEGDSSFGKVERESCYAPLVDYIALKRMFLGIDSSTDNLTLFDSVDTQITRTLNLTDEICSTSEVDN
ncbi:hypothetical protein OAJ77_03620 [Rhodospirillales bacterium]|nr:hypothetical protein [Rhodospirillales bacterium]